MPPDITITFGPPSAPQQEDNPVWVRKTLPGPWAQWAKGAGIAHWSRVFEYPWVMEHIRPPPSDCFLWVLDAAGGDGGLQKELARYVNFRVVNVDLDPASLKVEVPDNVLRMTGDVAALPFVDESFDVVMCVSVLEHLQDPYPTLTQLKRVLKKGGRLLITLDVTDTRRWNHQIDEGEARKILREFGLALPFSTAETSAVEFPEIDRQGDEPEKVKVQCLCFFWDKP
jgi:SAM-dependent methyltransferase